MNDAGITYNDSFTDYDISQFFITDTSTNSSKIFLDFIYYGE